MGIPMDSTAGRQQFARAMEARRKSEPAGSVSELPPCRWCIDSEELRQELLQQMTEFAAHRYSGPEWQETGEKKAHRLLTEELQRRSWDAHELKRRRKGEPGKIEIAAGCALRRR
jgi:hypothetical protein